MQHVLLRRFAAVVAAGALAVVVALVPPAPPSSAATVADQTAAHSLNPGGSDVIGVATNGNLYLYSGSGSGGFAGVTTIGSGWGPMDQVRLVGDLDARGNADVLARSTRDGSLWIYPGRGDGRVSSGIKIGTGWGAFSTIFSPGDWNGDGYVDLLAVLKKDGTLWLYAGRANGTLSGGRLVGSSWGGFTSLIPTGDFDGNGVIDFLARDRDGYLTLYRGSGTGGFSGSVRVGRGWSAFTGLLGPGDFDGDGHADVLARASDGNLYLYSGNGSSGFSGSRLIGKGWNGISFPESQAVQPPLSAPSGTITASQMLAALATAAERTSGYDRDSFNYPYDADGDCQNTRHEVLIRQSSTQVQLSSSGCTAVTGTWYSYYDGRTYTNASDLEIDHTVAMAEAWYSGAYAWTNARRVQFGNDLYIYSLVAVSAVSNQSKGAGDPAEWLPPRTASQCTYAVRWIAVKYRWNLTVDAAERTALANLLAAGSCGSTRITTPPRA